MEEKPIYSNTDFDHELKTLDIEIKKEQLLKAKNENRKRTFKNFHLYFPSIINVLVASVTIFILFKNGVFESRNNNLQADKKNLEYDNKKLEDKKDTLQKESVRLALLNDSLQQRTYSILVNNDSLKIINHNLIGSNSFLFYKNFELDKTNNWLIDEIQYSSINKDFQSFKTYISLIYDYGDRLINNLNKGMPFSNRINDSLTNFIQGVSDTSIKYLAATSLLYFGTNDNSYKIKIYSFLELNLKNYLISETNVSQVLIDILNSYHWTKIEKIELLQILNKSIKSGNITNFTTLQGYVYCCSNAIELGLDLKNLDEDLYIEYVQLVLDLFNKKVINYNFLVPAIARISSQLYVTLSFSSFYNIFINKSMANLDLLYAFQSVESSCCVGYKMKIDSIYTNINLDYGEIFKAFDSPDSVDPELLYSTIEPIFNKVYAEQKSNINHWLEKDYSYFRNNREAFKEAIRLNRL